MDELTLFEKTITFISISFPFFIILYYTIKGLKIEKAIEKKEVDYNKFPKKISLLNLFFK